MARLDFRSKGVVKWTADEKYKDVLDLYNSIDERLVRPIDNIYIKNDKYINDMIKECKEYFKRGVCEI